MDWAGVLEQYLSFQEIITVTGMICAKYTLTCQSRMNFTLFINLRHYKLCTDHLADTFIVSWKFRFCPSRRSLDLMVWTSQHSKSFIFPFSCLFPIFAQLLGRAIDTSFSRWINFSKNVWHFRELGYFSVTVPGPVFSYPVRVGTFPITLFQSTVLRWVSLSFSTFNLW